MLSISVVIPLAPGEEAWKELVPQLELPEGSEILLSCGSWKPETSDFPVKVVQGGAGRAEQMNIGAGVAANDVLWFLHADSRLDGKVITRLLHCLAADTDALYFFGLRFLGDGPAVVRLNEWAVRLRADWLKIPFGDQGFCVSKRLFQDLGGYREDVRTGEDHMFVWQARQQGYSVIRVEADIFTSARKYKKNGWLFTTALHIWLTLKQGVPELLKLMKIRVKQALQ